VLIALREEAVEWIAVYRIETVQDHVAYLQMKAAARDARWRSDPTYPRNVVAFMSSLRGVS
jgi:hypothetical protein